MSDVANHKRRILDWLRGLPERADKRAISGQQIGFGFYDQPAEYERYIDGLADRAGHYPAMIGCSLGLGLEQPQVRAGLEEIVVPYARRGGLVVCDWRPGNPWTGGDFRDNERGDFAELYDPGTEAGARWWAEVDALLGYLRLLNDAGVCPFFRPFHEMNSGGDTGFWWMAQRQYWRRPQATVDEFVALWRWLRAQAEATGCEALWVYGPALYAAPWILCSVFYPGDGYVDIVAPNAYSDDYGGFGVTEYPEPGIDIWEDIRGLGKPVGFGETGSLSLRDGSWDAVVLRDALRERFLEVVYFLVWNSWEDNAVALVDVQNAGELMKDVWTVTLDDVPNFGGGGGIVGVVTELQAVEAGLRQQAQTLAAQVEEQAAALVAQAEEQAAALVAQADADAAVLVAQADIVAAQIVELQSVDAVLDEAASMADVIEVG